MGNWDLTIGDRYLQRTVHEAEDLFAQVLGEEPTGPDPLPFKVYRGVRRYPLPGRLSWDLGDVRSTFADFAGAGAPNREETSPERVLSTLLHYGYGFSRWDVGPGAVWPHHRMVPSARCYFPTELYLWLPRSGDFPAGMYHYDTLHHAVALIREGEFLGELSELLGADLDEAGSVVLLSSLFWKNAFKYRGYSYRLCAQEAGMVVGNLLMVAGALGLRGDVHYQFPDRPAGRLLGLEPSEEHLFAALPLRPAGRSPLEGVIRVAGGRAGLEHLPPMRHTYVRPEGPSHAHDELFTSIAENCLLDDGVDFARELPAVSRCPHEVSSVLPAPPAREEPLDLGAALRARNSGNVLFNPVARTLPLADFWEIVRYATEPYTCDLRPGVAAPGVSLHVAVFDVAGLPPGIYRFCREHGGLHVVSEGDFSRPLQGALPVPNLNLCASSMALYLAADYAETSRVFGNRAYRLINLEAGLVAQRLCVLSAAHGVSARVHNGYDSATIEAIVELDGAKLTPFFQIAVAHNRPGVQHGLPVIF
ncbi:SagB family peptide dehydrogenase [Saccharopolyspora hattusasensis]|uniref:SagB family peptide dehydrogenase n=1 Tax=Saccharopolyspora hattusasensis TaxID=1128679 RepID=UPI003D97408B